jgi:hypothetical protein
MAEGFEGREVECAEWRRVWAKKVEWRGFLSGKCRVKSAEFCKGRGKAAGQLGSRLGRVGSWLDQAGSRLFSVVHVWFTFGSVEVVGAQVLVQISADCIVHSAEWEYGNCEVGIA